MKWTKLLLMTVVSFAFMYVLMYMMVDIYGNVYANRNQFYMAAAMTAAMMLIEIALMHSMYSRKAVIVTVVLSIVTFALFFGCMRNQTAITDEQFLKSMISHHGAALLMCEKNTHIQDSEIRQLCESIVSGQQAEIDWMKEKLLMFE